ncbi:MAG: C40 family peptidase [Bacteroidota bacterium]
MKGICLLPLIPCRAEPNDRSEMVNQLLYGEKYVQIDEEEKWVQIRSVEDEYVSWISRNQFSQDHNDDERPHIINRLFVKAKSPSACLYLPAGSTVEQVNFTRLGEQSFAFDKAITSSVHKDLIPLALSFLNTPYLWGGKSFFGIDCSGFCQVVFKIIGISLKRDAFQQADQGNLISFGEHKEGDLAFFSNKNGKIIHVGLLLKENQIIHASGKVRIDIFDEEGITHSESGARTHQLFSIKRYF